MAGPPLNNVGRWSRVTKTKGSRGGSREELELQNDSEPCRMNQPRASDREFGRKLERTVDAVLYVTPGHPWQRDDQWVVDGQSFRVVAGVTPSIPVYTKLFVESEGT